MTKRNLFPLTTDNGLTQNGALCSTIQSFPKSSQVATIQTQDAEKPIYISQNTGGRISRERKPTVIMSTTHSEALRVDFQKSTAALNRPLTPQLVFTKLNSPQFPENKQEKSNLTQCPYRPPSSS